MATLKKKITKNIAGKKTATKKPANKKQVAKKTAKKKKAIGFELMKSHKNKIEKSFENMESHFNDITDFLGEYTEEGKKKSAAECRKKLMDLIKEAKNMRVNIQESKEKLKPIYKED